ncbi:S16 family serine protease [Thermococcus sp.]
MKKKIAAVLMLLLLLPLIPSAAAQCPSEGHTVILKAPAVSKTSSGQLVGVVTDFVITVAPGSGHVYVETWPLAEVDMQASARLAAQVAGKVTGIDMSKYDVFIQIKANAPIIGGPSAGGTMTVGIIAALEGWKINPNVMMTGMINPDGTIGPVGGILEKAAAAHEAGVKLFLIPEGQRIQYVQQTEKKEVGGIVEIHSQTQKVDVVKYAKERWGLQVLEVSDIYQAVYYFTGHQLPKPQAPSYVNVDTSFLRGDAIKDYQNTTEYYQTVVKELKSSNVDYTTYTTLKQALDQAGAILNQSKESMDSGMYYTALSKDFQARIIIRHVQWYLTTNTTEDVEKLLQKVNSEINASEREISNLTIRGITMLQAIAAAQERVEQAKSSLQNAWKYYYSQDYWDAIGEAAYAYERAKTAVFWANLGKRYASGNVISNEVIKTTARDYIDESSLIATYIESMYGNTAGDLTQSIQQAEQYYEDGKYSAALFTAMEARVQGQVFLDTLGIDNWTVLEDKLAMMKENAKTAIGIAQASGIKPLLAIAYYEFAESYEKSAAKSHDIQDLETAMIFYQYARETAGLFLSNGTTPLQTTSNVTGSVPTLPLPTTTSSPAQTQNTTNAPSTEDLAFGIIMAIVAFVVGLGVGRKL